MDMNDWGYGPFFEEAFRQHDRQGRVVGRVRVAGLKTVAVTSSGEMLLRHRGAQEPPSVGDWVAVDPGRSEVAAVLPRRTVLARSRPGRGSGEQVLAANVDVALVLTGLDDDFSLRRIERYLTLAEAGGVEAVLVLSKSDLCDSLEERLAEVERVASGRPIVVASVIRGEGVDLIRQHLPRGRTAVLLGSSGVGKSTLLNALLGEERAQTRSLDHHGLGRHTTTHRELFQIPDGGIIADVPGLREVGVLGTEADVRGAFDDVGALSTSCRFTDCRHDGEPGCAVEEALERGELATDRLESYRALVREADAHALRSNEHARREHDKTTMGRWRKEYLRRKKYE